MEQTVRVHKAQRDFIFADDKPYIGFVGGRGAGKSSAGAYRMWRCCMEQVGLWGLYAPTYPMLNDTILRVFLDIARPHIIDRNLSQGIIRMSNGSEILCRSLDDPEKARGPSLRGAIWDEASLCHKDAFDILIACLRYEGKQGWLACTFTPKGPNHWTADVFNDPARTDVQCYHASTDANPFNPPNFKETLAKQYTSAFAEQELEGRFVSLSGGLFKREWFGIINELPSKLEYTCRGWDMAATEVKQGKDPDWTAGTKLGYKEGVWYVIDCRHVRSSPQKTEQLVKQTAQVDGYNTLIRMEEEGGSSGKSLTDHYARTVLQGFGYKGIRASGSKQVRAMPFASAAEAGNVKILKAEWNKEFLDEIESFSPDCKHDDIVDSCSVAMSGISSMIHRPSLA